MAAQLDAQALDFEVIGCDFRRSARPANAAWFAAHLPTVRPGALALSGAELGCRASHLTAWTRIVLSRRAAGTVIEDDVVLAPEFADCVRALEADLAGFDLVYLGTSSRSLSMRHITPIGDLRIHAPVGVVLNTWGYVVRTRWIERVLAQPSFALTMPIDHFLGGRAAVARPRIGVLQPACVDEDDTTGRIWQIAPHTWRVDRLRIVEAVRRRFLRSRAGDLDAADRRMALTRPTVGGRGSPRFARATLRAATLRRQPDRQALVEVQPALTTRQGKHRQPSRCRP